MKLNAFTIVEIIVVLIISGIIIAMSFWGISVLIKHFNRTSSSYSNTLEVLMIDKDIRKNMNEVQDYQLDSTSFIVVNSHRDSIRYESINDSLYRFLSNTHLPIKMTKEPVQIRQRGDSVILLIGSQTTLTYGSIKRSATKINELLR